MILLSILFILQTGTLTTQSVINKHGVLPERVSQKLSPALNGDILWEYRLSWLRQYCETGNWTLVKRTLDELKVQDVERYQNERLSLTRALAAENERKWHTVLQAYKLNAAEPAGLIKMGLAEAYLELENRNQARAVLKSIREETLPAGNYQEKRRFLLAELELKTGSLDKAQRMFQALIKRARFYQFRLPSYQYLIQIAHSKGERHKARKYAEKLQKNWPGSDEALYSVYFQVENENATYLEGAALRLAMVGYRNRDYSLSDAFFSKVVAKKTRGEWQRALYFKCLSHLKREEPGKAVEAFGKALDREQGSLRGTKYEGLAVFQMARALFLLGRDHEVIHWVENQAAKLKGVKWRWESEKLRIMAMRRIGRVKEFDALWQYMNEQDAPEWIRSFYHQNGMALALLQGKPNKARAHLDRLPQANGEIHAKVEIQFWKGVVFQCLGELELADRSWESLTAHHPNHYFGIAADHMLDLKKDSTGLDGLSFSAKEDVMDAPVNHKVSFESLPDSHPAGNLARIGRFDWAALLLNWKKDRAFLSREDYLLLSAMWFNAAAMPHQTILKSTALKALYPPGTAIEDLPLYLQKLLYPLGYYDQVEKEAVYSRIDPLLLESIIREETHFNAVAKSGASARGLMQFIPETARRISLKRFPNQLKPRLEDLYNPEFSISLGAAFLSQLQESFGYMSLYSIAAYNAGEGAVEKWKSLGITHDGKNNQVAYDPLLFIFDVTYSETKRYCQKVLATYYQYRRIYALKDSYPKGFVTRLGNAGESYYLKSSS